MSDNEKEYFVPEQLDDNDFEKEKMEEKVAKKEKKDKFDKQNIKVFSVKIISIILIIVFVLLGIYLYLNPIQKKATAPEQAVKEFCAYFNAGNWKKINQLMDFKGYYILGGILEDAEYTKFDLAYKALDEKDETYLKFQDTMDILTSIDEKDLNSVNIQIRLNNIETCNRIQGTNTLYKLRVNSENTTGILYISNASGEYKMVFGEWMQTILNYYQSVYLIQSNYGQ